MKVISRLKDEKIRAINVQFEMLAQDYVDIAKRIVKSNEFQRKRVKNSGTIYSLLKSDILEGCLIPPIVLASKLNEVPDIALVDTKFIEERVLTNLDELTILDGLQRTYSLIDLFNEEQNIEQLKSYVIRVELYLNITEVGILYRMLTLNAGQTPMSLRHQIEILYSGFADKSIGEINIIRQKDDEPKTSHNDYNYSDLIEGYNSYLESNESPIDRYSLLDIVKSLGKISNDNQDENSFTNFTKAHFMFVDHLQKITNNWEYPDDEDEIPPEYRVQGRPFGSSPYRIFNRTQALTGFGAAAGSLIEQGILKNIIDITALIPRLKIDDHEIQMLHINKCLDEIKKEAKKIGNAQRMFFRYFFRALFDNSQDEFFLNIESTSDYAKKRTLANM
ncbi:hypothetical protein [Pseudomonas haemolytica]|uniref:hypothetical protein n=1 Tax=Pseudomonas haemolytica TaxID=2600065 RepID=UPI003CF4E87E